MAKVDRFAQIAFNGSNANKDELCGIEPIQFEPFHFTPSEKVVEPIEHKDYEKKLKDFHEELNALKDHYKKFIMDYVPELDISRQQWIQDTFQFRFEEDEDKGDISRVLSGKGEWETLILPDYRGPIGKWNAYYRRSFTCQTKREYGKRHYLKFMGVDYVANVYLNGRYIGSHEGFFAPFEFDVTDYLYYGEKNTLVVEVKNDAPTLGIDSKDGKIDGDKIYAASGLGWNDSEVGWHHCPPGAGVYNKILIEERAELFIHSIFVRPDVDQSKAEVWVEVVNTHFQNRSFDLNLSLYSKNFRGVSHIKIPCKVEEAGPGINYYRFDMPMEDFRLWSPEEPWLYKVRVSLSKDGQLIDQQDQHFGMRKFHMDVTEEPKGTLYLNNEPVILRGANTMGHMQQCVIKEDFDQLIDDILIAKLANMNYYRLTQRPVQQEIYDYCDMLGMMTQTDLPFFGWIRRNQFCEAIRQSEEMERLIRSHPSSIMVTFINEPFPMDWGYKGHRSLFREEMEDFFEAASKVIKLNNPDRVIKNVEGDYDAPTRTGLSDFHCYNMWYTNHAIPIGKLHKGYLPALKKGRKSGCGEYGTEGLDPLEIMMEDYPKKWVPDNIKDEWNTQNIVGSQSYTMHGDWYEEQYYIEDWIRESQEHQALATQLMNDAFRRRSDVIVSTAVHLLIDAWPSGWMKTLVDYKRIPKPAYFEFKRTLEPIRVNLRTDRLTVYGGEKIEIESWVLNDSPKTLENSQVVVTLRSEDRVYESFEINVKAKKTAPTYIGSVAFLVPQLNHDRANLFLDASLYNHEGKIINQERLEFEVFEKDSQVKSIVLAEDNHVLVSLLKDIHIGVEALSSKRPDTLYIHSHSAYNLVEDDLLNWIREGTVVIFSLDELNDEKLKIGDYEFKCSRIGKRGADGQVGKGLSFVARNAEHPTTKEFRPNDFSYLYDQEEDCFGFIAEKYIDYDLIPLLFTYDMPEFGVSVKGAKKKLPIVGEMSLGKGKLILSTLNIKGMIGKNPVVDRFIRSLI